MKTTITKTTMVKPMTSSSFTHRFEEDRILWLRELVDRKFKENPHILEELLAKEGHWLI